MSVIKSVFPTTLKDGRTSDLVTLKNKNGMTLEAITYGCRVTKLLVPDKNGKLGDVILGHKTLAEYQKDYQGAIVGRIGNRIANAEFSIAGTTYKLAKNNGENSLHGGPTGFSHQIFDITEINDSEEPSVTFSYFSEDGHEGFPGNMTFNVTYKLTNDNEWKIKYEIKSDKETIVNPTQHAYFNLSGLHNQNVHDHYLRIDAEEFTVSDEKLIPTGELAKTLNTDLDFTAERLIGDCIAGNHQHLKSCNGYDINFCVKGNGLREIAELSHPDSGRRMKVYTDMPGVQLYTFNQDKAGINKDGSEMVMHGAACLETQFYPNSVNTPSFPFETLKPNETFISETIYKFITD